MNPRNHKLFKHFPIQSTIDISIGSVPTPYHIYDGFGLFIGGVCDFDATEHLLENEDVLPVKTLDGKALMGIWVCNFTEASLGPHHELQFSFFVSRKEIAPIRDHPFNTLVSPLSCQDVKMLCYGLWNNTPNVVAYNREILSLDALQSNGGIQRAGKKVDFIFEDNGTRKHIISGSIKTTPSLSATFFYVRTGLSETTNVGASAMDKHGSCQPKRRQLE
jgi:hypothetical protein